MNSENNNFGKLIVRARTAGGTIPVEGAMVYIRSYINDAGDESDVIFSLRTNVDGETATVELPAPPRQNSLIPDSEGNEYSGYNVEVRKNGYYTVENIDVPIFEGITSIQTAELIPHNETVYYSSLRPEKTVFEGIGYPLLSQNQNEETSNGGNQI